MNLQDFVKETLVQIARGVEAAAEELRDTAASVNPVRELANDAERWHQDTGTLVHDVAFDVAVTVAATTETSGGGSFGLQVFSIGAKSTAEETSHSVSRIRFVVPLVLPPDGKPAR